MNNRKYSKKSSYKKYGNLGAFFVLITSLFLSGCHSALLDPKGQIALQQRSLIFTAFGLMLLVVIPAIVMALYFSRKYRIGNKNTTYRPDWCHSYTVEAVVWGVPIIIITFLAILTWKSTHALDPSKPLVSDKKPVEIDVISLDWKWLFIYPKEGIATINEIAFPPKTPVNFRVTANSVMNSFFIPTLGSQIYSMAGMQTRLHLIANEPGIFDGISASYSGHGFSGMKFKAIATSDEQGFKDWVRKVKQSPKTLLTMNEFEKLAIPSENHPVEYFSRAKTDLFGDIINKFMSHGSMPMNHENHHSEKGAVMLSESRK